MNTTPKQVQGEILKLKGYRFVMWHLLHPDNELVHESRSMHPSKNIWFREAEKEICRRCDNFSFFLYREEGVANNQVHRKKYKI